MALGFSFSCPRCSRRGDGEGRVLGQVVLLCSGALCGFVLLVPLELNLCGQPHVKSDSSGVYVQLVLREPIFSLRLEFTFRIEGKISNQVSMFPQAHVPSGLNVPCMFNVPSGLIVLAGWNVP